MKGIWTVRLVPMRGSGSRDIRGLTKREAVDMLPPKGTITRIGHLYIVRV